MFAGLPAIVTLTARGRMRTVGGAEMAKLDNVRLGDTVVVVFTEALVLSLKETLSARLRRLVYP